MADPRKLLRHADIEKITRFLYPGALVLLALLTALTMISAIQFLSANLQKTLAPPISDTLTGAVQVDAEALQRIIEKLGSEYAPLE